MKNKKYKKMGSGLEMIEELRQYLKKYYVFHLFHKHQECIASEIMKETGICKSTLYNYIDKAFEAELIIKNFKKELHKKGSQFTVVAQPILGTFLKTFRKIIVEFSQKLSELQVNL